MNKEAIIAKIGNDVYSSRHFQEWYTSLNNAGHQLLNIKSVEWVKRINNFPLFIALHIEVNVRGENRIKNNEVVIIRPTTAHCIVWCENNDPALDEIIVVREYRTPVMNPKGFVYELPGGSSFNPNKDMRQVMKDELKEETGLDISLERFELIGGAQSAPTIIANRTILFGIKLSFMEMQYVKQQLNSVHGNFSESEITTLKIKHRSDIMDIRNEHYGWDIRGMISSAIPVQFNYEY
jgi:8-oxo-dGTP pyrophosphatase MutT (NUDIX family)